MEKTQLERLLDVPEREWMGIVSKLRNHLSLKLYRKTNFGAHCEQRLKVDPFAYYIDNAIRSLYEETWKWKHDQFSLLEQLKRIVDSMCSTEVKKYKHERGEHKVTFSVSNLGLFDIISGGDAPGDERDNYQVFSDALNKACQGNDSYKLFTNLIKEGLNYDEICKKMGCSKSAAYQMRETIGRRAKKALDSN